MLRGEVTDKPQESKAKPQYRTAQDDLRDAKLRAEAEAAEQDEEAEQPEIRASDTRTAIGNAESSEEEDDGGLSSIIPGNKHVDAPISTAIDWKDNNFAAELHI